jgi:DNA-binding MarR family transcriptional regulator
MERTLDFGRMHQYLAFQLHLTWRSIRKKTILKWRDADARVSRGSYSIPILIGLNPGVTPHELADALYLDASKVAFVLRELQESGIVCREPSPEDRRKVLLFLTPYGQEYADVMDQSAQEFEGCLNNALTQEEKLEFLRMLRKLR